MSEPLPIRRGDTYELWVEWRYRGELQDVDTGNVTGKVRILDEDGTTITEYATTTAARYVKSSTGIGYFLLYSSASAWTRGSSACRPNLIRSDAVIRRSRTVALCCP